MTAATVRAVPPMAKDPRAACRDPKVSPLIFFPEPDTAWMEAEAKRVCRGCEIRWGCLEWALATGQEFGVWGGMTARERAKEAKRRETLRRLRR